MEDPYYYRNKVHAAFGRDRKGNVISGIYEEKSHRIVSVDDCMIEDKKSTGNHPYHTWYAEIL